MEFKQKIALIISIAFVCGCGNNLQSNAVQKIDIGESYSPGNTHVVASVSPALDKKTAEELFLERIKINQEGITIQMKVGFQESFNKGLPVYFNQHFKGNQIFIPQNADLIQYRLPENNHVYESETHSQAQAFIAAIPISNMKENRREEDYTYRFLYLGKIKNNVALFSIHDGFKAKDNTGIIWYNSKGFRVTDKL